LTLARAALQGDIRSERDVLDLLEPPAKPVQASPSSLDTHESVSA